MEIWSCNVSISNSGVNTKKNLISTYIVITTTTTTMNWPHTVLGKQTGPNCVLVSGCMTQRETEIRNNLPKNKTVSLFFHSFIYLFIYTWSREQKQKTTCLPRLLFWNHTFFANFILMTTRLLLHHHHTKKEWMNEWMKKSDY